LRESRARVAASNSGFKRMAWFAGGKGLSAVTTRLVVSAVRLGCAFGEPAWLPRLLCESLHGQLASRQCAVPGRVRDVAVSQGWGRHRAALFCSGTAATLWHEALRA